VGEFQFTMRRPYSVGDDTVPWYAVGHEVDAKKSSAPAGKSKAVGLGVGDASHTSARVYGSCPGDGLIEPDTEKGPPVASVGDGAVVVVLTESVSAILDPGLNVCLPCASVTKCSLCRKRQTHVCAVKSVAVSPSAVPCVIAKYGAGALVGSPTSAYPTAGVYASQSALIDGHDVGDALLNSMIAPGGTWYAVGAVGLSSHV